MSPDDAQPAARRGVPAGLLRRLAAMVYDTMLIIALWMFTLFPMVAVSNDFVYGAAVRSVLFLEMFGFFAYFWVSRGQTLGMLAWGLEVCSADGSPFTLTQATLRFCGALASFACLGLGYLWILIDRDNRSWSDLLSGSRVLRVPKAAR
ncbi:MAG: RDD family protein [Pseudomonadales bacterium]